jgi:hypothetical protein
MARPHSQAHSELRLHRDLTEKAVQDPLEIRFSIYDSNCRTYYGVGPRSCIMIAVVIDVANGFVKTEWSLPLDRATQ